MSYYEHFKYQSIDSEQFKAYFLDFFKSEPKVGSVDWDAWFNNPGMPLYKPNYDDSLAKACNDLRDKWVGWNGDEPAPFTADSWSTLSSAQKIEFLALLLTEKEPLR